MSVSLEKGAMPAPEGEKSSVDYVGLLQEAQPDINAGRIKDVELAHAIANGQAGGFENASAVGRQRAMDAAIADKSQDQINVHLSDADSYRASADRIYDKIQQTKARAEDTKR